MSTPNQWSVVAASDQSEVVELLQEGVKGPRIRLSLPDAAGDGDDRNTYETRKQLQFVLITQLRRYLNGVSPRPEWLSEISRKTEYLAEFSSGIQLWTCGPVMESSRFNGIEDFTPEGMDARARLMDQLMNVGSSCVK